MIIQGMSQIREAYFISFRGKINQKNMEERENEMKQKKTEISAEKQEQWILQGKYVILAVLVGICVGIVDTIFGRGLLAISDFREQYYRYLLPILPVAGLAIVWQPEPEGDDTGIRSGTEKTGRNTAGTRSAGDDRNVDHASFRRQCRTGRGGGADWCDALA